MSARLIHASLADTSVSEGGATIGTILEVIDEIKPTTVYTHTNRDVHQDHRNAHSATLVAARGISRVFCYQAPSTTVEFKPTRFVAIDEFLERKIEVIQAYSSQVKIRAYLDEELLRATARYWSRFSQARYVEPLEVVRDSDAAPFAARRRRWRCAMPADSPRVLVTGVGGPSGISILRAHGRRARDDARRATSTRSPPASTSSTPARRSILPRGDDPRFTDHLLEQCRRDAVDVVIPTVDSELLPLARRRAEFADAGTTLVLASVETLETCLDKWALAERCRRARAGPGDGRRRRRLRPRRGRAAGDRQAARGQRLAGDPARRAPRRAGGARARRHAARAGAPAGAGVLARRARARRRARRRGRPARAAEGRLGDRRHRAARCTTRRWRRSPARSRR